MKLLKRSGYRATLLTIAIAMGIMGQAHAQTLKEGMQAEELSKYENAKSIYANILAKEPSNAVVYYHLGIIAYHNFQLDSAKYLFNKGIQINASEPLNYIGLGLLELRPKNYDAARQDFDKALSLSNNKDAYVMQQIVDAIWMEQDGKDGTYALNLATKAVEMDKKNPRNTIALADANRLNGESTTGLKLYRDLVTADPKYLLAQLRIGQLWMNTKSYDGAAEAFNKILATDPNYPPVYPELADMYTQKGNIDKARESYVKFLSLVGSSPAERLRYASFLYLLKDYPAALEQANQAYKYLPNNKVILRIKAYCEYQTKAYPDGLQTIQRLFSSAKPDEIIDQDYLYYGKLLSKNNQDSMAIIYLNKALKNDSANAEVYDLIAQGYSKMKKYKEAAATMETKIRKTMPNVEKTDYYYMGQYYFYADNYVKADTSYAMVIVYFPTYAPGFLGRARSLSYQESDEAKNKAKPFWEKFIVLATPEVAKYKSQIIEGYNYLGTYYYNNKDVAKAKEEFGKILEIDPDNQGAKETLKQISGKKK